MRKIYLILAAFAAMSVLFSCEKEQASGKRSRSLGVEVKEKASEDVKTKSAEECGDPYLFEVNGDTLMLTSSMSEMAVETGTVDTKGDPITNSNFKAFTLYFRNTDDNGYYSDGESPEKTKVSYDGSDWNLDDDVLWPKDEKLELNFYASNCESHGSNQTVAESFLESGGMQILYEDSGKNDASEGENDLLYAWTKKSKSQGIYYETDPDYTKIGLTFHHLLAGIKFELGDITSGLTLTGVTLKGVKTSGTCTYKEDSFAWTRNETTVPLNLSSVTTKFYIMPQDIADAATLTFSFEYDLSKYKGDQAYEDTYKNSEDKLTITKTINLKDLGSFSSWDAGKMYTYRLTGNLVFAELGYTMGDICSQLGLSSSSAITSVEFSYNDKTVSKWEVSSLNTTGRSVTPIYATYNSGKLTLHTTASRIFFQPDSHSVFNNLTNITSISGLDKIDTRNVTDMSHMFESCGKLNQVDVSSFNTSRVQKFFAMFDRCSTLTSIDISGFSSASGISFDSMFSDCYALTSVKMGDAFDLASATSASDMFFKCSDLTSLDVSHFETSNITDMRRMFFWCKSLETLDVSGFDTSSCTDMSSMFNTCWSLTELNVSGFNTENVTDMSNMFYRCYWLTTIDVSGFNTGKVRDMSSMFQLCIRVTALDVSSFDTSNVTTMNSMFADCRAMKSLAFSSDFKTTKVTNMQSMFFNCYVLPSIDLSSFDTSNVTTMDSMFTHCHTLASLNLKNFNTAKVQSMGSMFAECYSLTSLDLSSFSTSNVKNMGSMFSCTSGQSSLKSVDLSSFDTSNVTDMSYMFNSCAVLDSLNLSKFSTANVTTMQSMFNGCRTLTSLDLSSFNTAKVTNMASMFCSMNNMKELNLGSGFTMAKVTNKLNMMGGGQNGGTYTSRFGYSTHPNIKIICTDDTKTALTTDTAISEDYGSWTWELPA